MRKLMVMLFSIAAVPALADQAADIANKASDCWALPAGLETPPMAEFDVTFDGEGNVTDATVIKYSPNNAQGKELVRTASRALQMCEPYPGASGKIRVLMDPKTLFGGQKIIDPFK